MAMPRCQLLKLLWSPVMLVSLCVIFLAIVQVGDSSCRPQTCNGRYACTSSTMNLSVSVSEAVQSLVTSDIRQAALQFSWQPPPDPSAAGAIAYKLCVIGTGVKFGCPFLEIVRELPMNTTQYKLVHGNIRFQCPFKLQLEFLSTDECQGCAAMTIPQLVIDLYEKDPVIFANFSHIPDIATGWYELVVNLTLPQSSSPYLVAGAPCVKVEWAKVPLDETCQPLHLHQKNRIALFSTKDLIGMWTTTSVSLPPLSATHYEVAARACRSNQWFLYRQPVRACHSFAAPVLLPAPVEGVWTEVWANISGQLNATVGWDARVASYGKMKFFEVDIISESSVRLKKSNIYQVPVNSSELHVSLQLPNARERVLTRVRAVSEHGNGNWSREVVVYDGSVQLSPPPAQSTLPLVAIIASAVVGSVVLVCVLVLVVVMAIYSNVKANRQWRPIYREWCRMPACSLDTCTLGDDFEVDPSEVICNEEMGSIGDGNFGKVWSGTFRGQAVAIKTMRRDVESSMLTSFLAEIQMLKRVTHGGCPHVVNLVAASSFGDLVLIVMELAAYGSLLDYLHKSRNLQLNVSYSNVLSSGEMLDFATQIAKGMEFIASRNVIHRDLACRNVLLADNGLVKVCDFGLSRAATHYTQCSHRPVPLRWMAPESIAYHRFTTKSDVWSFGVTVWEIYTLGEVPYNALDMLDILPQLQRGLRLPRPALSSNPIHALLMRCWMENPLHRPSFSYIVAELEGIMEPITVEGHELEGGRDGAICGREEYVKLSTLPPTQLHIEVTETASEESHELEGGRDGAICGQDGEQEDYVNPSTLPPTQLHIKATETASEGPRNGCGDVAMISQSQDSKQEERLSISASSLAQPHVEEAVPFGDCHL